MTTELHMLPIQAGDATLIVDRSTGRPYTVLIDAGLARDEVVAYLQSAGVYHLDLIILSHPDLDHLKGLLSLVRNQFMSIGELWCFDLSFLRDFIQTGAMPRPQEGTHVVSYDRCCYSLVSHHNILKSATLRGIRTLQVSEGHRANLGSLHLEVLYPWNGFYRTLRSARNLKRLLNKKWPEDWRIPESEEREADARELTREAERDILDGMLREYGDIPPDAQTPPLARVHDEDPEEEDAREGIEAEADDTFPASMLGTLYNNLSIVVKIHVLGGINAPDMLFPGDLTDWTYLIARRFPDLTADIFKYPHHGSSGPGISQRALRRFGFPFPRRCPCGPWCHPECCEWHYRLWHRMERRAITRDATALFAEVVRPSHTLVYPYPSQGLPNAVALSGRIGQIHANRMDTDLRRLADPLNPPAPRILGMGKERHDVRVISVGA